MPNLDGTGPQGQGPMTGGRRGRCRNVKAQNLQTSRQTGDTGEIFGSGRGRRPGGGKGNDFDDSNRKGRRRSGV